MAWSDEDLKASVARLAEPADRRLEWLRGRGLFPSLDELALEFDDEFARVRDASGSDGSAALFGVGCAVGADERASKCGAVEA
jgi:hypothetical protein